MTSVMKRKSGIDPSKTLKRQKIRSKISKGPPQASVGEEDSDSFEGFTSDPTHNAENDFHNAQGNLNGTDGSKSRESHQKQKALTAARKATKPHADDIAKSKKLWEKLRRKSHIEKEERQKLVAELFELITGRVHDFVFKHDSVRVIQCAVKYSTIAQKKQIAHELKGSFKALAENRYSKFLVAKMIVEADQETKNLIIPEFYGHVRRLINHPEASWILDDIYRGVATKQQKIMLLKEWYGPEFSVFQFGVKTDPTSDLSVILERHPEKRTAIMKYLFDQINHLIQKKMTGFTMLHDAMLQYFKNLTPGSADFEAFERMIIGDNKEEEVDLLKNLAFTKSGSEIVALTLAYSSAKDRRQILKSYKGVVELMAYDKWAYRVIISALDVLDDTRELIQKIYSELVLLGGKSTSEEQNEKVINLAMHQSGSVVLLYPFVSSQRKLVPTESIDLMSQIHEIRKTTSKKDSGIRQKELVTPLSPICIQVIQSHANDLIRSSFGALFISDILLHAHGDKHEALKAVAALVSGDPNDEEHLTHSPSAGKTLKAIIAGGPFDHQTKQIKLIEPRLGFAEMILPFLKEKGMFKKWLSSEGAFVVLQLMEAPWENSADGLYVKKQVRVHKLDLEKASKQVAKGSSAEQSRISKASHMLLEKISN